jgi:hypothetical protein
MATLPFPRPPSLSLPVRPPLLRSRSTGEGGRRPRPGHGSRAEKVASGRRAWGLAAAASHGVDPGQAGPHPHRRRVSMAGRPLPAEAAASALAQHGSAGPDSLPLLVAAQIWLSGFDGGGHGGIQHGRGGSIMGAADPAREQWRRTHESGRLVDGLNGPHRRVH